MISKKLAAALGAGALGAAGAGTLGAKLLGKGKEKIKLSESDEKVVSSADLNWSENVTQGQVKAIIQLEGITWECGLHPIAVGYGMGESYQTKEQWDSIKGEIKNDLAKRKNFVKNCAESRTAEEKKNGNKSVIELEAEKTNKIWKFKDFEKILTEDFTGLKRLEGDEAKAFSSTSWEINETAEKKITVIATHSGNKKWSCIISGTSEAELTSKTFKKKELEDILKAVTMNTGESEKRRYLIRNCRNHKNGITGLTVQTVGSSEWKFKDLEKITEGIYSG